MFGFSNLHPHPSRGLFFGLEESSAKIQVRDIIVPEELAIQRKEIR